MKQYEYLIMEVDKTNSADSKTIRYIQQVPGQGGYTKCFQVKCAEK